MRQFKVRASSGSKINGVKALGKTGESYVQEWYLEQLFGRKKEFSNKFTEKGLIVEDDAIDLVAENLDYGFLTKNEEYFENEFFTGTPDIITIFECIDVKSSWDLFTFPFFEDKLNPAYFIQGQIYMNLTGKRNYKVVYCLLDTPIHLIEREAFFYCKNNGFDELDQDTFEKFKKKMTFGDIPKEKRTKVFEFSYDETVIEKLQSRVLECRELIKTFKI